MGEWSQFVLDNAEYVAVLATRYEPALALVGRGLARALPCRAARSPADAPGDVPIEDVGAARATPRQPRAH